MRGGGGVSRVSPSSLRSPPYMIAACWWHAPLPVGGAVGPRPLAAVLHNDHSLPLDPPGIALAESHRAHQQEHVAQRRGSLGPSHARTAWTAVQQRHGPWTAVQLHNDGCCMQHRLLFMHL